MRLAGAVLVTTALALGVPQADEQPTFSGTSEYDQISVEAIAPNDGATSPSEAKGAPSTPSILPPVRQWRITPVMCFLRDLGGATVLAESCDEGHQLAYEGIECDDDEQAVGALFEQRRQSGGWSDATLVEDESCLAEQRRQIDIPAAALEHSRRCRSRPQR